MDISKIDNIYTDSFSLSYEAAHEVFNIDPINAPAKIQRKIRKWMNKTYFSHEVFPEAMLCFVGKQVSDADFINFAKECYDFTCWNNSRKKELFAKASEGLTDDVKTAFEYLQERDCFSSHFKQQEESVEIGIDNCSGYVRSLILFDASNLPEHEYDNLYFETDLLRKEADKYILKGITENYSNDTSTPFTVSFSDAKAIINCFRTTEHMFVVSPWNHLQCIAQTIIDKCFLYGDSLNAYEKDLLPVLAEIIKLSYFTHLPENLPDTGLSILKAYVKKYGYNELISDFEALEKVISDYEKKLSPSEKLTNKLNNKKYEPLWRELFNLINESQTEYPTMSSIYCDNDLLNNTRNKIQQLLHTHGYIGTYPDFEKESKLRVMHFGKTYRLNELIGKIIPVRHHIHCTEEFFDEHLSVEFLCGTKILEHEPGNEDIYSYTFNNSGKSFFHTISYESDYINDDGEGVSANLEECIQIAVKKIELKKLSRAERKSIYNNEISFMKLFFFLFIVTGIMFSLFVTFDFTFLSLVIALILTGFEKSVFFLISIPWWRVFLLLWGLFDIAMGIITILVRRKSL